MLKEELLKVKERFATPRRTTIEELDYEVDIEDLDLWADVNVLFRATGYDFNCDTYRADDDPDILAAASWSSSMAG